jgi:hypothetical protein
MLVKITKRRIDALTPGDLIVDEEVRGCVVRKLPSGVVTYGFRSRDKRQISDAGSVLDCTARLDVDSPAQLAAELAGATRGKTK